MPDFSVIIPTFRRLESLEKCLHALSQGHQTLPSHQFEVIVSDDEWAPMTRGLVQRILPTAIYVEGPRLGSAANRNKAATYARGKWLVFTDDDCVPEPGWLESYKRAIHDSYKVYEGKTTCKGGFTSPLHHAPANETGGYLWSCNMMLDAELFRSVGGFDERFPFPAMEDVDFRERLRDRDLSFPFVVAAAVDHPPRKVRWLRELISHHKSYLFFCVVKRREFPRLRDTLLVTVRTRVRSCLRPAIGDLPKAIWLFSAEFILLCLRYHAWRSDAEAAVSNQIP